MRKVFISPSKYIQGEDELLNLGYFVSLFGEKALLIVGKADYLRVESKLRQTEQQFEITFITSEFQGEVSQREINRLKQKARSQSCDCVIGLGGGKAIDAAKCVAQPGKLIVVPTIVSTDAPTSSSAVLYTEKGLFQEYVPLQQSPAIVLIDTTIIAQAPTRFLVSGMGDALATYFEARATRCSYSDVGAGLSCGGLPAKGTNTAFIVAKACYDTLLLNGEQAKLASEQHIVTPALEAIIEANILMSGLGFENGGLAAAHAIHDGLSILPESQTATHGEKIAFCTVCQLLMENAPKDEVDDVLFFSMRVGLPICLSDIGITNWHEQDLEIVAKKACSLEEPIHSMSVPVTEDSVKAAIIMADQIGQKYKQKMERHYSHKTTKKNTL